MNIIIKKLKPELVDDYVYFFDTTKHDAGIDEHKCYCVCWCSDDHSSNLDKMSSVVKRRELAAEYIKEGTLQGYLAYFDDKVVGWCNTNTKSDCLKCISWIRFMGDVPTGEKNIGIRVKSIFCFVIAPEMHRKGTATKLLERVIHDATMEGYDFVEAYPNKSFINTEKDFMGPVEMYKKLGFKMYKKLKEIVVMRRSL